MNELLAHLKQRKLVQWTLAYLAAGWVMLQALGLAVDSYDWPHQVMQVAFAAIALGFVIALVIAWYHGEKGRQRVSGAELLLIALVLAIGGGLLWRYERATPNRSAIVAARNASAAQRSPEEATTAQASVAIPAKSVAVLPFVNMSGDPKNDYFSDGITEEILDALTQVPNLKVAARTSAFAFKGKAEDLRKVGEVLDVATVLEGSIQKSGDEVRITAQLIDTRSGYHLWSEKYDRKLTSIFAVEDEISKAIADKLKVQLAGGSGQSLVAQKAVDPRAHDFYLRGLTLLAVRSVSEAVDAFQQAVAVDPDYAQAWAALAEAQALLFSYAPVSEETADTHALAAAQRALALNSGIALAYVAQGMVYTNQMRWADADRAFRRALTLAPGDAEAMNQYAQFLFAAGQLEPALTEIEGALQRDPLSGTHGAIRAELLLVLHRHNAAVKQIESTLATHPDGLLEHRMAMWIYLHLHRYPEAEQQMRMGNPDRPEMAVLLVRGIVDPRLRVSAVKALETSPELADVRADAIVYAAFLAELGENDRALAMLEGLGTGANSTTPQILWYPLFDPIRNTPRFKAVLKKIGLPYSPQDPNTP